MYTHQLALALRVYMWIFFTSQYNTKEPLHIYQQKNNNILIYTSMSISIDCDTVNRDIFGLDQFIQLDLREQACCLFGTLCRKHVLFATAIPSSWIAYPCITQYCNDFDPIQKPRNSYQLITSPRSHSMLTSQGLRAMKAMTVARIKVSNASSETYSTWIFFSNIFLGEFP